MHIAENLTALRKAKNLTQNEAADLLGVVHQTISKWERGESLPDIEQLPKLASLYKVSIDELIGMSKIIDKKTINEIIESAHKLLRPRTIGRKTVQFALQLLD